jgi:hypothetical protein
VDVVVGVVVVVVVVVVDVAGGDVEVVTGLGVPTWGGVVVVEDESDPVVSVPDPVGSLAGLSLGAVDDDPAVTGWALADAEDPEDCPLAAEVDVVFLAVAAVPAAPLASASEVDEPPNADPDADHGARRDGGVAAMPDAGSLSPLEMSGVAELLGVGSVGGDPGLRATKKRSTTTPRSEASPTAFCKRRVCRRRWSFSA